MRVQHPVFHAPHNIDLTFQDLATPDSYKIYPAGADLGETLPMWQVQTEGYSDAEGMLIGTVSYDLSNSPDGEFISGGKNAKGPNSMAIGRQGSILHWGFAASPTYMTDEAKLVFVNSICYIHQFKGQRAFVKQGSTLTRESIDFLLYQLSDQGAEAWREYTEQKAAAQLAFRKAAQERKSLGERLSDLVEAQLKRAIATWDQTDVLDRFPEELQAEFGDDIPRYVEFYDRNRRYLYAEPSVEFGPLLVDEDAKELGIANNELALLDKCVELLLADSADERANRLLRRYTEESFQTAEQWQAWLDANRDFLVFSEESGFKFLVDINKQAAAQAATKAKTSAGLGRKKLPELVGERHVAEPSRATPVTFQTSIIPESPGDGLDYRLIVKFRILEGWHLYASVPPGEPYVPTTLKVELDERVSAVGGWESSEAKASPDNFQVAIWENECVFTRKLRVARDAESRTELAAPSLELTVNYQACDEQQCMPPTSRTFKLKIGE